MAGFGVMLGVGSGLSISTFELSYFLLFLIQMMRIANGEIRQTRPQKTPTQIAKITQFNMRLSLFYSCSANHPLSSSNGSPESSFSKEGSVTNFSTATLDC